MPQCSREGVEMARTDGEKQLALRQQHMKRSTLFIARFNDESISTICWSGRSVSYCSAQAAELVGHTLCI